MIYIIPSRDGDRTELLLGLEEVFHGDSDLLDDKGKWIIHGDLLRKEMKVLLGRGL